MTSRVICVGLAVLDVVQRVQEPPRWGTKGVADSVEVTAGGPATNAAIAASTLGAPVTLVTALGHSPQSEIVRLECASFGVDVIDLAEDHPEWELPVASCVVDASGERTVVSTGALASRFTLGAAARELVGSLPPASVLLFDGHHPTAAEQALAHRPEGTIAVLDAGSAKPHAEEWLSRLDVVAGSADYARGLGLTHEEAIAHVLDAGTRVAVITDGAGPVRWQTSDGDRGELLPPAVTAVDTLGAGDAWHGSFAAALALGRGLRDAVEVATRAAATRVAHSGARAWLEYLPRDVPPAS